MNPASESDLLFLTIRDVGRLIRAREISPVELTRLALERIERLNSRLNAFITVTADWALALATAAEREIAGGTYRGPLHGVPIGIKDLYDTAGIRTTAGSGVLIDNVPTANCTAVARLLDAGAVILGKQNMHEFAAGFENLNAHFGTTHNPWDLTRITGGSSGGTANAIATGLGYAGMGSDTGGSIRVPSAFCGITGLKPTYGRVSVKGVVALSWSLDHAGPMARSAEDCGLLLNAVAGYDAGDVYSINVPTEDYTADVGRDLRGARIGIIRNFLDDPRLQPEVKSAVETGIGVLADLGAATEEVELPLLTEVRQTLLPIIKPESVAYHARWVETRPEGYGPGMLERFNDVGEFDATKYANALRVRAQAIREHDLLLSRYDALIGPTALFTAPTIAELADGTVQLPYGAFTSPFDVDGLPALSLPCGFDQPGLPIGMMLVGRRWGERTIVGIGDAFQRATTWHRKHPIN